MKLYIYLLNDKDDLAVIEKSLEHFDCSISLEDDDIVLAISSLINNCDELSAKNEILNICSIAKGFLDSINGVVKLEKITFPELKLKKIALENKDGSKTDLNNPVSIEGCLGLGNGNKLSTSKIASLICKDDLVAKTLRLYSKELDWVNLYRIFELIKKSPYSFDRNKYEEFSFNANHGETVGDNARHGDTKDMPPRLNPITLSTARALVSGLLREWLYDKIKNESQHPNI